MSDKGVVPRIKEQHKDIPIEAVRNIPAKNELRREEMRGRVEHEKSLHEDQDGDCSTGLPHAPCE